MPVDEPYTPEGHRLAPNPANVLLRKVPCDHCDGTGWAKTFDDEPERYCGSCEGKGIIQENVK